MLFGLAALAVAPLLIVHFRQLWSQTEYQYFPFVFLAVAGLLASRWGTAVGPNKDQLHWRGFTVLLCLSLLMLCAAVLFFNPWAAAVSFILLGGCGWVLLSHYRRPTNLWGIWALFWLIIPLPLGLGDALTQKLQRGGSVISSELLDLLGINHTMHGNTLALPTKQLFVDEACSGIVSVMSVVACAAIYAVWCNRSLLHALVLIGTGVFWATLMNVLRITAIAVAEATWQIDLSTGGAHEMLSVVVFLTTILAVASTDQLLEWFLSPIRLSPVWERGVAANPLLPAWNGFVGCCQPQAAEPGGGTEPWHAAPQLDLPNWFWIPSVFFGLLALFQVGEIIWKPPQIASAVAHVEAMPADIIPQNAGVWTIEDYRMERRDEFDPNWGASSHIYQLAHRNNDRLRLLLTIDFPFETQWHELTGCYRSIGWLQTDRTVVPAQHNDGTDWNIVTGRFENAGRFGYLAFCFVDADGQVISPSASTMWERLAHRFTRGRRAAMPQLYQIQAFVDSRFPLDTESIEQVHDALRILREPVQRYIAAGTTKVATNVNLKGDQ